MQTLTVPTDITDLIALLFKTPTSEHPVMVERLAEQLGNRERAHKLFDEAASVVARSNEIDALRGVLGVALRDAEDRLREATHLIERLASSSVYDAEYAETTASSDLQHMVANASRAVRIARGLQKQIES